MEKRVPLGYLIQVYIEMYTDVGFGDRRDLGSRAQLLRINFGKAGGGALRDSRCV